MYDEFLALGPCYASERLYDPGVFTLSGEIYMVLYVTTISVATISDVVAAYCIPVHKCEGLGGNRERSPYCKARVPLCTSVCVLGCALASVPLPLALWYSADLHPLYL